MWRNGAALVLILAVVAVCAERCVAEEERRTKFAPPKDWKYNTTREAVPGKINIHLGLHTHDDTGWLLTVDEYYYTQVRYILDTVTEGLAKDPNRRFSYVEMAFFSRWWEEQSEEKKSQVRAQVASGQLEFLNGGWCMHDEAGPLYSEMVDQTTRGHQFILKEFGAAASPRATWQIDPFGHSATQSWLLSAAAGMPSMFWWRMDFDDRLDLLSNRNMEYIWRASESLGASQDTLASVIWGTKGLGPYACPVNFETYESMDVLQDNPDRHGYNVEKWVDFVVQKAQDEAKAFIGGENHVLWTCGMDFNFKNADMWFHNLEVLMHYVNLDGRVNMLYSTPGAYVEAKHQVRKAQQHTQNASESLLALQVRPGDLMPLHEEGHMYWTGYFASRVAFKRLVRSSSSMLQAARQIESFVGSGSSAPNKAQLHSPIVGTSWTDSFEGALALAMHHDGVSGTAKQAVNNDYAQRLSEASDELQAGMASGINHVLQLDQGPDWKLCQGLNISVCDLTATAKDSFSVAAWNPRAAKVLHTFRIPVKSEDGESWSVVGPGNNGVEAQLVELGHRTLELPKLYLNWFGMNKRERDAAFVTLRNKASHVLVFQLQIPPIGVAVASIKRQPSAPQAAQVQEVQDINIFDNGMYQIELDSRTRALKSITNIRTKQTCEMEITWGWYESSPGGCTTTGCSHATSGAYVFRPQNSAFHFPGPKQKLTTNIVSGPLSTEIRQQVSPWVSHVIRLNKDSPSVEIEYTVGPIPLENEWLDNRTTRDQLLGKEVAVRYRSCLDGSNGAFQTDSNGLEMMDRVRDERPKWHPQTYSWRDEPVSSNYYPVNAMISLQDEKRGGQFTIVTDSTQGGTSLHDGELELMVHRRTVHDDDKGVKQALNETMCGCNGEPAEDATCYCHGLVIRGVHQLVLSTLDGAQINEEREDSDATSKVRSIMLGQQFQPTVLVTDSAAAPSEWSGLADELPPNLHIMTITQNYAARHDGGLLVRIQHIYSKNEDPELSKPQELDFGRLFAVLGKVSSVKETTLTANKPIEEKLVYEWNPHETLQRSFESIPYDPLRSTVTMQPMEIRTFIVSFAKQTKFSRRPSSTLRKNEFEAAIQADK